VLILVEADLADAPLLRPDAPAMRYVAVASLLAAPVRS
jgi:hypothetical protein